MSDGQIDRGTVRMGNKTEIEKQVKRQTDRHRDILAVVTHRQAERHKVKTGRETYRQDERRTDRQRHSSREIRQIGWKTSRKINRQAHTHFGSSHAQTGR
jgi:hypothetical protein